MRLSGPVVCLLLALAGCGGGAGPEEEVSLGADERPSQTQVVRVAALGDSITAGSPLWDPDEEIRASIGSSADPKSQYEFWARRRMPEAGFTNCGVFGERTDEIARRLEDCAQGADVLIVQGGINDIAQMRPVEEAAASLRAMVVRGQDLGLRVALVEVLPWNNGYPAAAAPIRRLNRSIAEIGDDEGVPVYPWYGRLEDPRAPGRMKAEWTIDGDHPSVDGYKRLGDVVELP